MQAAFKIRSCNKRRVELDILIRNETNIDKLSWIVSENLRSTKNLVGNIMDRLTSEHRGWLMSRVKSKNTTPEMKVRSSLHKLGYRYALHKKELPGKPDLVFVARKQIIFVNGCYWHGHHCKYGMAQSKSNVEFWREKIRTNRMRDAKNCRQLRVLGWQVLIIWECKIKRDTWLEKALRFLEK
jgi:DNA mismatch endonuclease (patch repair protein)